MAVDAPLIRSYTRMVRLTLNIIGLLLLGFGVLWILQGLNILGDALGSGENKWGLAGAGVLLAAIVILASANRNRHRA